MPGTKPGSFGQLLDMLVRQYGGTKQELARAVGLTPSAFSRLRLRPPSVEVCLRLAMVTGTSAARIMRAAGHAETNDLIEDLYGPSRPMIPPPLTPGELKHIHQWRALSAPDRRAVSALLVRFFKAAVVLSTTTAASQIA